MNSPNISQEARALELLSAGIESVQVASALGISESRLSQMLADEEFAKKLADAKFKALAKHNATDNEYDDLEKKLIEQLKRALPLVMDPLKITRILQVINAAKRRGISSSDAIVRTKPIIRLSMPVAIVQRFQLNAASQVIEAGVNVDSGKENSSQTLVTLQSQNVANLLNEHVKTIGAGPGKENHVGWDGKRIRGPVNAEHDYGERLYVKPQGRSKQDLLSELGFSVEVEVSSPAESS